MSLTRITVMQLQQQRVYQNITTGSCEALQVWYHLPNAVFQVIHHLACYKAIPHNTTNYSLRNYTCIDVDG